MPRDPSLARPPRSPGRPATTSRAGATDIADDEVFFPRLGELLRRAALGGLALLFVARAYYPSEDAETGTGLVWILCLLGVAALAVAANLVAGETRFRSVAGRRGGIRPDCARRLERRSCGGSSAGDHPGLGMGRAGAALPAGAEPPAGPGESATLAAVLVATAVAVAAYGLYQVPVEFAQLRQQFTRNPAAMMARLGIVAGTPAAESFQKRLMDSNEPFSTFALANSLAGFLVGPWSSLVPSASKTLNATAKRARGRASRSRHSPA